MAQRSKHGLASIATMGIWGIGLATTPIWGSAVAMATVMLNDSDREELIKYQIMCFGALVLEPISMLTSVVVTYKLGFKPKIAMLPLAPVAMYASSLGLASFAFDKINNSSSTVQPIKHSPANELFENNNSTTNNKTNNNQKS